MELSRSPKVEVVNANNLAPAANLLLEPLAEGAALIFDQNTGATTLINDRALILFNLLCNAGVVSESTLSSMVAPVFNGNLDFSDVLSSLENSKLVIRC